MRPLVIVMALVLDVSAKPRTESPEDKARRALAVIDGATWTRATAAPRSRYKHLDGGDGYEVRRPSRAFGEPHVVEHLRHAIAEVRALYPGVHTLAIGDLSAENGGKISDHRSHQTGLDVDVGFYFKRVPTGYPDAFVSGSTADLDLEATWALLAAFAHSADRDDGVAMIFLDYAIQKRLYDFAHDRGTPDDELDAMFQYPRGRDALVGLVRHWPNHANHLHVRFKSTH